MLAGVAVLIAQNGFKNYVRALQNLGRQPFRETTDEFYYDQVLHLAKSVTELITYHTVEEAQELTNTTTPMPPWGISERTMIPMHSCEQAAEALISYFGPEELYRVVGGPKWWQMRALHGVQAEWISQYTDYVAQRNRDKNQNGGLAASVAARVAQGSQRHEQSSGIPGAQMSDEERDRLGRVMLYIHGGAYYFGSTNTHRYQILRIARKFGGFALSVNYRQAPQFPFPCALQDCLAAYLYLIDPPPGAPHGRIDPSKIVIAGDSAGGGITLALLQVLRDLGLQMPAGGVLISPWVDLTHSFPSVMDNTDTDLAPTYGFIHKPSALWPTAADAQYTKPRLFLPFLRHHCDTPPNLQAVPAHSDPVSVRLSDNSVAEIQQQVQLYATNAQLTNPLVSPALAGSLGGLPPLYFLAGDEEVLRDEIIYTAHRAANPGEYPPRPELLENSPRNRAAFEKYRNSPTKVHLQVYDHQCHVLTILAQTTPAKYAFRAIASFIKYVTGAQTGNYEPHPYRSGALRQGHANRNGNSSTSSSSSGQENQYSGRVPLMRPEYDANMIRERVSMSGAIRPMEPASQISALQQPLDNIGRVLERPYLRFNKGHDLWEQKYQRAARRAEKQRRKYERRYSKAQQKASKAGLLDDRGDLRRDPRDWRWTDLASCGPLELSGEAPPPSAIVGRRDTQDSLALLQLCLRERSTRRAHPSAHAPPPRAPSGHKRRPSFFTPSFEEPPPYVVAEKPTSEEPRLKIHDRFSMLKRTYAAWPMHRSPRSPPWTPAAAPRPASRPRVGSIVYSLHMTHDLQGALQLVQVPALHVQQVHHRLWLHLEALCEHLDVLLHPGPAVRHVAARGPHEPDQLRRRLEPVVCAELPYPCLVLRPQVRLARRARRGRRGLEACRARVGAHRAAVVLLLLVPRRRQLAPAAHRAPARRAEPRAPQRAGGGTVRRRAPEARAPDRARRGRREPPRCGRGARRRRHVRPRGMVADRGRLELGLLKVGVRVRHARRDLGVVVLAPLPDAHRARRERVPVRGPGALGRV